MTLPLNLVSDCRQVSFVAEEAADLALSRSQHTEGRDYSSTQETLWQHTHGHITQDRATPPVLPPDTLVNGLLRFTPLVACVHSSIALISMIVGGRRVCVVNPQRKKAGVRLSPQNVVLFYDDNKPPVLRENTTRAHRRPALWHTERWRRSSMKQPALEVKERGETLIGGERWKSESIRLVPAAAVENDETTEHNKQNGKERALDTRQELAQT